jgi:phosphohistidine swiveling domain-containing protein
MNNKINQLKLRKERWHRVVSFKTELFSEYLIHKGYRSDSQRLLPSLGKMCNRMIVDNDIYVDLTEVEQIQAALRTDVVAEASIAYEAIERQSKVLGAVAENIPKTSLTHTSTAKLLEWFDAFCREYQASLGMIGIPTIIDLTVEHELRDAFDGLPRDRVDRIVSDLAVPEQQTLSSVEHERLLQIKAIQQRGEDVSQSVSEHARTFGWVRSTLFQYTPYGEHEIRQALSEIRDPERELQELVMRRRESLETVERLVEQYHTYGISELARLFQRSVYMRTARLEWMNQACFQALPLMNEIAERMDMSFDDVIYLTPEEMRFGLMKTRHARPDVEERQRGYALLSDTAVFCKLVTGSELEGLKQTLVELADTKDIVGQPACPGKVQGVVVVVRDRTKLHKVTSENMILVTPLTTPDFVAVMRRVCAIVTDLGGITSHAAIVARELKKPCIIGTKIATQVLKDGDLVEVDAEKGVVRVLNRAVS